MIPTAWRYARTASAALVLLTLSVPAQAQVSPGDVISRKNVEKVSDLVSPGILFAVENGMDMTIMPYKKIPILTHYQEATEKFSDQVSIGEDNDLKNWVAGRPFPTIDSADPKAAAKVMWNFQRTHYYTDDLNVHLPDADTGAFYKDSDGKRVYQVERHFIVDWSRRLRFQGRTLNEPIPSFPDNPDEVFEKQGFFPLIEPFDLKGVGTVSYRYLDPARLDDTWLYTPVIRRVRRLSSAQRSDALFGQDIDLDSFGGYAGQVAWFDWKLLGVKPMLASLHGENLPPKVCEGDGGVTYCESWEVRPEVYVIEGTPRVSNYAYSKRVIYVDREAYIIPYSDLYDLNEELWKTVIQNIRTSTKPNPNAAMEYPEERMFVYAFTVIDIQLGHGTRAAIPGMQFPEEAGWYIDIGFDTENSVEEEWFQVSALIGAGR
ncbi:MAG: hypothetical protein ACI8TX_000061 [Hyphomicrobiaceae bacterium]